MAAPDYMDDCVTSFYNDDQELQALCTAQLAQHDDALRELLFATLVAPNMARLRAGNETAWNQSGWYRVVAPAAPALLTCAVFPVPDGCGAWHAVERDVGDGVAFRFFSLRAWLELAVPADASTLSFLVPHAVMPEALGGLTLQVDGAAVAHRLQPLEGACVRVRVDLDPALLERARQAGRLTLELATAVAAIPALIYPGSCDYRHLSLAICLPYFDDGVQRPDPI